MHFEWDENKETENIKKHDVSFILAQHAFLDERRIIARDLKHSTANETRYYCIGLVEGDVMTVRFTNRGNKIRIIGAGYWRKGRKEYEKKKNKIH